MTSTQTWDPKRYARNARFVSDLAGPVVDLLAPQPGERILDLGCGDGILTAKLVAMGCEVVGVDSSAEQVAAARRHGVDGRVVEGENLPFAEEFDAVFSNAALHWMRNPQPVLAGVWRALRRRGRFVAEMGGYGGCAKIEKQLIAGLNRRGLDGKAAVPWYFPTVEEYSALLNGADFSIKYIGLIPRPTLLPGDITGWLDTFAESFTSRLPVEERTVYVAEVREGLGSELCDPDGKWTADYVRLRFVATKLH
jgi:SAM-dependent methyltransferase